MAGAYSQADQTAMLKAMRGDGDIETVTRLLDGGTVQLNPATREYDTHPLVQAIHRGQPHIAILLVERGANVNAAVNDGSDYPGRTPLMVAAHKNELATLRYLLDHGASINIKDGDGDTALHLANRSKHMNAIRLLIERMVLQLDLNLERKGLASSTGERGWRRQRLDSIAADVRRCCGATTHARVVAPMLNTCCAIISTAGTQRCRLRS